RQRIVQFELDVEMILDHGLVAAGHEDEMLDSGLPRLVDDMLDHRPVENGQHFLGHGLGRGKKARTESSHGEYCLSYSAHGSCLSYLTSAFEHFHAGFDKYL